MNASRVCVRCGSSASLANRGTMALIDDAYVHLCHPCSQEWEKAQKAFLESEDLTDLSITMAEGTPFSGFKTPGLYTPVFCSPDTLDEGGDLAE